jgi:hypothetical protein
VKRNIKIGSWVQLKEMRLERMGGKATIRNMDTLRLSCLTDLCGRIFFLQQKRQSIKVWTTRTPSPVNKPWKEG